MASAFCPDCNQKIVLGPKPRKGQWVVCPHCNAELEIVSIRPLELDWASDIDDDEDDEELDFDDDDLWDDRYLDDDEDDWDDDEEEY
ncbi:MAG: hypothetical protein R3300_01635 [Candidatus Promineifilaceae bacterium]|nr:hypothetical protein [Candidatus Promineifilaceae bacterium]